LKYEKRLRATRIAKAAHLSFAPVRRLMTVLGAVAYARSRFDEDVLYMSELHHLILPLPLYQPDRAYSS
jgi:hypothetical protein